MSTDLRGRGRHRAWLLRFLQPPPRRSATGQIGQIRYRAERSTGRSRTKRLIRVPPLSAKHASAAQARMTLTSKRRRIKPQPSASLFLRHCEIELRISLPLAQHSFARVPFDALRSSCFSSRGGRVVREPQEQRFTSHLPRCGNRRDRLVQAPGAEICAALCEHIC